MGAQGCRQLQAHARNQPRRHRAHAAQGARHGRVAGPLRVHHGCPQCQHQRKRQHARQRRKGPAQAKVAIANHDGQVHHIGPRHHLGHGPVFQELLVRHPALFLDQFALHHGHHAAKTLQGQPGKGPEQVRHVARAGRHGCGVRDEGGRVHKKI